MNFSFAAARECWSSVQSGLADVFRVPGRSRRFVMFVVLIACVAVCVCVALDYQLRQMGLWDTVRGGAGVRYHAIYTHGARVAEKVALCGAALTLVLTFGRPAANPSTVFRWFGWLGFCFAVLAGGLFRLQQLGLEVVRSLALCHPNWECRYPVGPTPEQWLNDRRGDAWLDAVLLLAVLFATLALRWTWWACAVAVHRLRRA